MKTCYKCGKEKEDSDFYKDSHSSNGLTSSCKQCQKEYQRKRYEENKEHIYDYEPVEKKVHTCEFCGNKFKSKYNPKYCSDKCKRKYSYYYLGGKERILEYQQHMRDTFPKYRLHKSMHLHVWRSLNGSKKNRRWEELVGYTIKELKDHLEAKFKDGMNWNNYGEWHVDHIIPKSAFNYNTPDNIDFKRCWSLDNIQPLWANDNYSKNNTINESFQPSLCI